VARPGVGPSCEQRFPATFSARIAVLPTDPGQGAGLGRRVLDGEQIVVAPALYALAVFDEQHHNGQSTKAGVADQCTKNWRLSRFACRRIRSFQWRLAKERGKVRL